tara:strand:+ start:6929 stop:7324 length:396 start_codon:yes stop_codon:yes gene_type:complete
MFFKNIDLIKKLKKKGYKDREIHHVIYLIEWRSQLVNNEVKYGFDWTYTDYGPTSKTIDYILNSGRPIKALKKDKEVNHVLRTIDKNIDGMNRRDLLYKLWRSTFPILITNKYSVIDFKNCHKRYNDEMLD